MVQTFPENTLPGFEACLKAGVGFELDVRRTRDGRLVVLHDATLDRTTNGTGKAADLTLEEVRKFDAGTKHSDKFAGTPVPELAEVFRLLARHKQPDLKVCIDLKINDGQVEADVVKLAKEAGVLNQLLFIGTAIGDSEVRRRLRTADPGAHVCCLADKPEGLSAALEDGHSDWAYVRFIPTPEEMKAIRTSRKRVLLVGPLVMKKETENWKKAAAAGVDAILSDYPVELRDALLP
jgi:glycerophosphoryl diester phosphodiesterase